MWRNNARYEACVCIICRQQHKANYAHSIYPGVVRKGLGQDKGKCKKIGCAKGFMVYPHPVCNRWEMRQSVLRRYVMSVHHQTTCSVEHFILTVVLYSQRSNRIYLQQKTERIFYFEVHTSSPVSIATQGPWGTSPIWASCSTKLCINLMYFYFLPHLWLTTVDRWGKADILVL